MRRPIEDIMRPLWLVMIFCLYPVASVQADSCCSDNHGAAYPQSATPITMSGLLAQVVDISPLPTILPVQKPKSQSSCPCCPSDSGPDECTNCVGCASGSVASMDHVSAWSPPKPHPFIDLIGSGRVSSRSVAPGIRPPKQTCS